MYRRSGFLVGPKEQVKLMMKPVRRVAAVIYLAMIVVVLSVAIAVRISTYYPHNQPVIILFF